MRLAFPLALCFALPAMAKELPVRAVTLSNAGLALVEHAGALAPDEAIVWSCIRCGAEGRISHWQGTLWDLSDRGDPHA